MVKKRSIKIFISSPSDVGDERLVASDVIDRLAKRFKYHLNIEPVMWEWEPLLATGDFPEEISRPSDADIVVVILWSRLGKELPEKYCDKDGNRLTGTEWEFLNAKEAFEESQDDTPNILVYKKNAPITVEFTEIETLKQYSEDKKRLDLFWKKWFEDDEGSLTSAFKDFNEIAEFESYLEKHIHKLIVENIESNSDETINISETVWADNEGNPFLGLSSFEVCDSSIFFGRTKARHELRDLLKDRINQNNASILVVGCSGSGKSSIVKAGLIADIKKEGAINNVALCRHAIMKPSESDGNLIISLVNSLVSDTAIPELLSNKTNVSFYTELIESDLNYFISHINESLVDSLVLKKDSFNKKSRLVLLIDQLEELFTIAKKTQIKTFVDVVEQLAKSGHVWIVSTLRSDFLHRLDDIPKLKSVFKKGTYFIDPPSPTELSQIIRMPARAAGVRFGFDAETGITLDGELQKEAERDPYALPLLEFTLELLFNNRTGDGILSFSDYRRIGGLLGALASRANEITESLSEDEVKELPYILRHLVTASHEDAQITAVWAKRESIEKTQVHKSITDIFLESRLFVAGGTENSSQIRLAHEALIHHWDILKSISYDARNFLVIRNELLILSERFYKERDTSLLLQGNRLEKAQDLMNKYPNEWSDKILDFMRYSVEVDNKNKDEEKERLKSEADAAKIRAESAEKLFNQEKVIKKRTMYAFSLVSFFAVVAVSLYIYSRGVSNKIIETKNIQEEIVKINIAVNDHKYDEALVRLDSVSEKIKNNDVTNLINAALLEDVAKQQYLIYERKNNIFKSEPETNNKEYLLSVLTKTVSNFEIITKERDEVTTERKNAYANALYYLIDYMLEVGSPNEDIIEKLNDSIKVRTKVYNNDKFNSDCRCVIAEHYYTLGKVYHEMDDMKQAVENTLSSLLIRKEMAKDKNQEEYEKWNILYFYYLNDRNTKNIFYDSGSADQYITETDAALKYYEDELIDVKNNNIYNYYRLLKLYRLNIQSENLIEKGEYKLANNLLDGFDGRGHSEDFLFMLTYILIGDINSAIVIYGEHIDHDVEYDGNKQPWQNFVLRKLESIKDDYPQVHEALVAIADYTPPIKEKIDIGGCTIPVMAAEEEEVITKDYIKAKSFDNKEDINVGW